MRKGEWKRLTPLKLAREHGNEQLAPLGGVSDDFLWRKVTVLQQVQRPRARPHTK